MADRRIDYDQGVYINVHPATGMDVFMYVQKPGYYYNAFGTEVAEQLARESGFDVDTHLRARRKNEMMSDAMQKIEAELEQNNRELGKEEVVVEERGGFKIIDIGLGRHQLKSPDGDILTPIPIPLEQAKAVFEQIAPKVEEEKPQPSKAPVKRKEGDSHGSSSS